jgi:signal transduction histidine kinase
MKSWKTWLIFGMSFALVLVAMVWVTALVLRLEDQADREQNVRLALWRMESTLGRLLHQESVRPYFTYLPFYPADRAYSCMFDELQKDQLLVPSPLLTRLPDDILLHFQFGPDGELTSPQVPGPPPAFVRGDCSFRQDTIEVATTRMGELLARTSREALLGALSAELADGAAGAAGAAAAAAPAAGAPGERPPRLAYTVVPPSRLEPLPRGPTRQSVLNRNDWETRNLVCAPSAMQEQSSAPTAPSLDVHEGLLRPLWAKDALLLVRRVTVNGLDYVQGSWLDWPAIERRLAASVADLLPQARLAPVKESTPSSKERSLAALPVVLAPGEIPAASSASVSPIRLSLGIVWGCVLLAVAAVAGLLWAAISLSERRGAFVSAVTHELRTPLTTFRMYTEMLSEGMVQDESKRKRYLHKLRGEADRLTHLVENVLGYARLEGGRASELETISVGALLERVESRLPERAEQARMTLVTGNGGAQNGVLSSRVRVDAAAVEQILFNLVDNACKYAAGAADRRIHLEAERGTSGAVLRVRDHGPGVPPADAGRLFQPFSKSDREAAQSAPGIGLGLAFSRRLARSMGGDLRLAAGAGDGATFELSLPAA